MVNHTHDAPASAPVLVLGRALHAPWNEGARVMGRNIAQAASLLGPVAIVSVTHETFRGEQPTQLPVNHVYTRMAYGAASDYLTLPATFHAVLRMIIAHQARVAHLVGMPPVVAPVLHRRGVRVVAHVGLNEGPATGRLDRMRVTAARRMFDTWIDAYACTSSQLQQQLMAQGYPASKLHVIVPPVDIEQFRPLERTAARRRLAMNPHAFTVVYVGPVSPERFPVQAVVQALNWVAPRLPSLNVTVFAPVRLHNHDPIGMGEHLHRAMEGAAFPLEVRLQDLNEEQKTAVYNAADVVLLPFAERAAVDPPLTLLEAMACGAVVAVSPAANQAAVVQDGTNGLVIGTLGELGARLEQLVAAGPDYRTKLMAQARATMSEQYSFAAVAVALEQLWSVIGVRDHIPGLTSAIGERGL